MTYHSLAIYYEQHFAEKRLLLCGWPSQQVPSSRPFAMARLPLSSSSRAVAGASSPYAVCVGATRPSWRAIKWRGVGRCRAHMLCCRVYVPLQSRCRKQRRRVAAHRASSCTLAQACRSTSTRLHTSLSRLWRLRTCRLRDSLEHSPTRRLRVNCTNTTN